MMLESKGSLPLEELDLLQQPFIPSQGIARERSKFSVLSPWSIASFGRLQLKRGWWRIECQGGPSTGEVRLSSDKNPLIVIPLGGDASRIFLADRSGYFVSLMISPWPGNYTFDALCLRKLSILETWKMAFGALGRLSRHRNWASLVLRTARRLMAGHALGLSASSGPIGASNEVSVDTTACGETSAGGSSPKASVAVHMREGDRLHQDATGIVRAAFEYDPNLKIVYSDVVEGERLIPHPEWDADLASFGAFDDAPVFAREGEQVSYDISSTVKKFGKAAVARVPLPLVERDATTRSQGYAKPAPPLSRLPSVSIIIPTKYRIDLLAKCLRGLSEKTDYSHVDITIIDNGVTDPKFLGVVAEARKSFATNVLECKGPFNFSRLVNAGVAASRGEVVLLLNDDVEPIEAGWMHRMISSAASPDVGAVGARLLYPDRSVQHAGVVLGLGGSCAHLWRGLAAEAAANIPYIVAPGPRMAVTGACLAVKRSDFELVGGFDEAAFPVAYNDIDFCLRLHVKDRRNYYRGDAVLIHHESQSRGADEQSLGKQKRMTAEVERFLERWRHLLAADPYFSPAFDPRVELGVAHPANFAPRSAYLGS